MSDAVDRGARHRTRARPWKISFTDDRGRTTWTAARTSWTELEDVERDLVFQSAVALNGVREPKRVR